MDINELDSFKLSDAIKFHDELNPRLWVDHKLDSEVRDQLLLIAKDFVSTLGISDLNILDITVSGSNAAYSYTPHSDLDLHIVVDIPKLNDDVYRELFTAKKTLYNDSHDITVHGVPVEVYIQDVNEPVTSLGEYSVTDDKWIHVPKKKRANFDEVSTKAKYENLSNLVELALQSQDLARIEKSIDTVRRYRKAGLAKGGEFSPENLAYKAIRSQGGIDALYDLRDKLRSKRLSIEEATSRDDAILKIKKLQNTAGRTDAEKETINHFISKMMQQYNIKPEELGPAQRVDPLKAKMAAAAYEKTMAAAAFQDEWNKFKGKFKGFFTETTRQSQYINAISDDLARKIMTFVKEHDSNILNYFKKYDVNSVPLFSEKGSNIGLPMTKNRLLNAVVNNLTFQIVMNDTLPDVPASANVKPMGAYYPNKVKIVISIPIIKKYSRYSRMSVLDSLRSTIAHELVHALDDAKSNAHALLPKGEYLKLPQEVNARLQEVLLDIGQVLLKNRDRLLAYPDTKYQSEYLRYLIKWSFDKHRLADIYEINDPRYKRLVSRTYKFFVAELANPELKVIDNESLLRKALNWLTTRTLEEESIDTELNETTEESQIVNIISRAATEDIMKELKRRGHSLADFFTMSKKAMLKYYGIRIKDLNIPEVHDPVLKNVLDTLTIIVVNVEVPVLGRYISSDNQIEINLAALAKEPRQFGSIEFQIANVISHEIQHAIDNYKSKGKALVKPKDYNIQDMMQYLRLRHEINARLQQVLHSITHYLTEREKTDGTPWTSKDLPLLIEFEFTKHFLTRDIIDNDKIYKRLLSRTYKFFDTELKNPKKVTKKNIFARAYNYVVGKPTSEITEASDTNKFAPTTIDNRALQEAIEEYYKKDSKWFLHRIHGIHQLVSKPNLRESAQEEVKEFWNQMIRLDNRNKVKLVPGNSVSVIQCWTHLFDSTFELRGNLTPKKIVDVYYDDMGAINYIQFEDGSTFPDKAFLDRGQGGELYGIITTFFPSKTSAEHMLTMLNLVVPNGWKLSTSNLNESSLNEASGYIPSEKEKNDPRFKTALTIDVGPDAIKKNAKAFGFKTTRAGIPPQARPDGKISEDTQITEDFRFQEKIHINPAMSTLKALAKNNQYSSAKFIIDSQGNLKAGDSRFFTHHMLEPDRNKTLIRGFITYSPDGYHFNTYGTSNHPSKDHTQLRKLEKSGIKNGNVLGLPLRETNTNPIRKISK